MNDRKENESIEDMLKKLKDNVMSDSDTDPVENQADDGIDILELSVDELMKKFLSEDEYSALTKIKDNEDTSEKDGDNDLISVLSLFDGTDETEQNEDFAIDNKLVETEEEKAIADTDFEDDSYAIPDEELFSSLSAGGKVCDIPSEYNTESNDDTKDAPLRKGITIPYNLFTDDDNVDNGDTEKIFDISSLRANDENFSVSDEATFTFNRVSDDTETNDTIPFEFVNRISGSDDTETPEYNPDNGRTDIEEIEISEEPKETDTDENIAEETEETPDIPAIIEEDQSSETAFDETDANLMIAFGMDEELNDAIGKDNADKLRSENDETAPVADKPVQDKAEPKFKEYISPAETKEVLDGYKVKFARNAIKLFAVAVVVILLFFYENLSAMGGSLPDAVDPDYYPTVNIMVGLQILFIGFAVMSGSIYKGFVAFKNKKPIPESFLGVILAVTVIFSVCACNFAPGTKFVTLFMPAALSLLLCAVNERLDLKRELLSFNIVSSKLPKFAFEKLDINDAELETKAFNEYLPKQPSIFKINKTSFVDGYFRRTNDYLGMKQILKAFIPVTIISFVFGIIAGFAFFKDFAEAIKLGYLIFSFAAPSSVFLAFGLPSYRGSKVAFADKSAFVGEASLDEYTTAASISFDDREVFPTAGVKLKSVKVFGSGRIDNVIYYVSSIYSVLGGPFSDILNVATADLGRSSDVDIINIDTDGIEATVDGKHIYAGRNGYLLKNGYTPVTDLDDEDIESEGEISIMFLVCDDEVIAKLYIRYRIDPGFEKTIKRLYKSGICVGIKTIDPNINDEMLSTKIKLAKYPVRVLKYAEIIESRHGSERTDSGIVSKKSAKSLLNTFALCDKIKHIAKTNIVVNIINIAVGIVIASMIAILGSTAGIFSIYIVLFQIFWIIPMYLMAKFML